MANMNICSVLYILLCYVSVNLSSCASSLSLLLETLCSSCHPAFYPFLGESLDSELTFQSAVFYFLFLSLFFIEVYFLFSQIPNFRKGHIKYLNIKCFWGPILSCFHQSSAFQPVLVVFMGNVCKDLYALAERPCKPAF